ncbi:MAG: flagellar protein FliT [Rhodoferax sp.]|nr:flagellar protein FliT [Rhodoferax sp.]
MEHTLLGCYQAIEESSLKMLDAARQRDWDAVVRYEGSCALLIAQLRQRAKSEALDAAARREKTHIMQRILQNDAQIRYLAEPWLAHCAENLDGRHLLH